MKITSSYKKLQYFRTIKEERKIAEEYKKFLSSNLSQLLPER